MAMPLPFAAIEAEPPMRVIDEAEFAVHEKIILVENTLKTLQDLARLHRQKLGIPILAITGTNGKTTTKELVSAVLSKIQSHLHQRKPEQPHWSSIDPALPQTGN